MYCERCGGDPCVCHRENDAGYECSTCGYTPTNQELRRGYCPSCRDASSARSKGMLQRSIEQFLTIYGPDRGADRRSTRALMLRARLSTHPMSDAVLRDVQAFLTDYYPNAAGTDLTGADGLDMDEAYAANLWREIQGTLCKGGS